MGVANKPASKAERIEVRVTPAAKALLTAAAQARHTTVSEFLLTNGIEAAEQAIYMPRVVHASEQGWAQVMRILDEEGDHAAKFYNVNWLKGQKDS